VAVIVNDMSEINVDAQLVAQGPGALSRVDEKVVEMSNGCICCTLREDLLVEVGRLAREGRFDYLLIESTGISEPLPVAETFTFEDENGESLSQIARLDTMVSVVDCSTFLDEIQASQELRERDMALGSDDERTISELLVDQVEFANVLVLNKCDLAGEERVRETEAVLRRLNPKAKILRSIRGQVDLNEILNTGLFDLAQAEENPEWLATPRGELHPETEEYGISSIAIRARRPFHPARFLNLFMGKDLEGVLRAKGLVWVATRNDIAAQLALAGKIVALNPMGLWAAALPEEDLAEMTPEDRADLLKTFDGPYGDRRQELVFIGRHLNRPAFREVIESALLTDEEMALGPEGWMAFEDPLPAWVAAGGGDDNHAGHNHADHEVVVAELGGTGRR
jgi:G3E family GTPase